MTAVVNLHAPAVFARQKSILKNIAEQVAASRMSKQAAGALSRVGRLAANAGLATAYAAAPAAIASGMTSRPAANGEFNTPEEIENRRLAYTGIGGTIGGLTGLAGHRLAGRFGLGGMGRAGVGLGTGMLASLLSTYNLMDWLGHKPRPLGAETLDRIKNKAQDLGNKARDVGNKVKDFGGKVKGWFGGRQGAEGSPDVPTSEDLSNPIKSAGDLTMAVWLLRR